MYTYTGVYSCVLIYMHLHVYIQGITHFDVLPENQEVRVPTPQELHAMGIQPENFATHCDFVVRHAFRKSLFCREWGPCTVRTDVLELNHDDLEAFVSQNWDRLQESVAPQVCVYV